jgi:MFS family permease
MYKKSGNVEIDEKIKNSLDYSVKEGSAFSVMTGFAERYFGAFAIFLNATVFQAGLIGSFPLFLGYVVQLASQSFLNLFKSRRTLMVIMCFLRTLLFIPFMLTPFMGQNKVWFLLLFISLYYTFIYLTVPAWTSWMGDLVDEKSRGIYFGKRSKENNFVLLISIILAGFFLEHFSVNPVIGFGILFLFAFGSSLMATWFLTKKYDIPYKEEKQDQFSFIDFSKRMFKTNFGMFTIYNFAIHFSVYIAAPYFVPYMLDYLKFTYLQFMIVISLAFLAKVLFMPVWGEFSDIYGNRKVILFSTILVTLLPFLWILNKSFIWVCFLQLLSGLSWAGFDISILNYVYDSTSVQKRPRCTSYMLFYRGLGVFLGGLIGGLLYQRISFFGSGFYAVFLLSTILRLIFALPFAKKLKETKLGLKDNKFKDMFFELFRKTHKNNMNMAHALIFGIVARYPVVKKKK